jgi:hypothetical protein
VNPRGRGPEPEAGAVTFAGYAVSDRALRHWTPRNSAGPRTLGPVSSDAKTRGRTVLDSAMGASAFGSRCLRVVEDTRGQSDRASVLDSIEAQADG